MAKLYPNAPVLRVNHISAKDGGYLRPHQSHQSGRDAGPRLLLPGRRRAGAPARPRALHRPGAKLGAPQGHRHPERRAVRAGRPPRPEGALRTTPLRQGENQAWLDSLFHDGRNALVQHARRHRDHFHVRFYNARAQELGRRVLPLLGEQPEQNVAMHRVKSGDTLGHIALKYGHHGGGDSPGQPPAARLPSLGNHAACTVARPVHALPGATRGRRSSAPPAADAFGGLGALCARRLRMKGRALP